MKICLVDGESFLLLKQHLSESWRFQRESRMRRTSKIFEGVRDDRGRLGRLLLVGGFELLGFFFVSRMLSVVAGHSRLEQ